MLLTEEEAKKRWCPMVRYTSVRGVGINRWTDDGDANFNPDATRCLGSECMAWKWREDRLEGIEEEAAEKLIAKGWQAVAFRLVGPRGLQTKVFTLTRRTDHGSCGLASVPQS